MVTAWAKDHQLPAFHSTVFALIMADRPDAAQYLDMFRNASVRHRTEVSKYTEDRGQLCR